MFLFLSGLVSLPAALRSLLVSINHPPQHLSLSIQSLPCQILTLPSLLFAGYTAFHSIFTFVFLPFLCSFFIKHDKHYSTVFLLGFSFYFTEQEQQSKLTFNHRWLEPTQRNFYLYKLTFGGKWHKDSDSFSGRLGIKRPNLKTNKGTRTLFPSFK